MKRRASEEEPNVRDLQDYTDAKKHRDEHKRKEIEEETHVNSVVEGEMENGMKPQNAAACCSWTALPTEMKTIVVSNLDNRAKRALRATSLHNYQVVNQFRFLKFFKAYTCVLVEEELDGGRKRWWMKFCLGLLDENPAGDRVECFGTYRSFIDGLQRAFHMIDTIRTFQLKIYGFSEPFQLTKDQRKMKVRNLHFEMYSRPNVVNGFLSQFEENKIDCFNINGQNLGLDVFRAYRTFWLGVHMHPNDAQMLNLRAYHVEVSYAERITVRGLKNILKRMLVVAPCHLHLTHLSQEVLDLFDYGKKVRRAYFFIHPRYTGRSLKLHLALKPRKAPKLIARRVDRFGVQRNSPIILGPQLQTFIREMETER